MVFAFVLLVILCLTGGLDLFGMLAFGVEPQGEISTSWITLQVPFNLDWWGIPYAPQSFTTNLYYAPQHFFGALIGTALLYASLQSNQPVAATLIESIIVVAASAFWSPYVAVGLAALAIVLTFEPWQTRDYPCSNGDKNGSQPCLRHARLVGFAFGALLAITASLFLLASTSLSAPQLIVRSGQHVWLATHLRAELRTLSAGANACVLARSQIFRARMPGVCMSAHYPRSLQGVSPRAPRLSGSVMAFTMIGECGSRCRCQSRWLRR